MIRTLATLSAAVFLVACSKDAPEAAANANAEPAMKVSANEDPGAAKPAAAEIAKKDPADHGKFTRLHANPKDGKLAELLTAAAKRAKAGGRKLFVELGAGWCEPCQAIEK